MVALVGQERAFTLREEANAQLLSPSAAAGDLRSAGFQPIPEFSE
jgi:hypothetical protein